MGKDKKKKGNGAEKTAAKTERRDAKKLRKELKAKGEEDIESLIAKFTTEDQLTTVVSEELCDSPSRRSNFILQPHPDKSELFLFGGEFFNGTKTLMFNDLYCYNIKKNEWKLIKTPNAPPPRCAHQAVTLSQGGGQIWVFGGEFASPSQSQFYHYKDFWVYHIKRKEWEKVAAKNGPSGRSGHRMCVCKRNVVLFGGFHDNAKEFKYYNDVYAFNLDTYEWTKLNTVGNGPSPRSACQIVCTVEGKIVMYGGYSKIKGKKDSDNGIVLSDMFTLEQDAKNLDVWRWTLVKQTGSMPISRSGFGMISVGNNKAVVFGGVHDEEEDDNDEDFQGNFYNDLHMLDLDRLCWSSVTLKGVLKDDDGCSKKKKVTKVKENDDGDEQTSDLPPSDDTTAVNPSNNEDDVFKVTIGPVTSTAEDVNIGIAVNTVFVNQPRPRMNASLTFKHGLLYLYGGCFEDGDKQITLKDFYSLNISKLDEWKTIIKIDPDHEWINSESESEDSGTESD